MNANALVSIVVPTYNGSRYLEQSLSSCFDQTYDHIEVIVVDDASTDGTPAILDRLRDARSNMRVVRHERNQRLPAALNTGFAHSRGAYLTWTSDDNRYEPNAIALMVQHLETHPETGLVYCDFKAIDQAGDVLGITRKKGPEMLATENTVGACFLYRRSVAEVVGAYDPEMVLAEDYDYWLRIAKQCQIDHLDAAPYHYRSHPDSLSRAFNGRIVFQAARARCRHVVPAGEHDRVIAQSYRTAYASFRAIGDLGAAWECAWKCLVRKPFRPDYWRSALGTGGLLIKARLAHRIAGRERAAPGTLAMRTPGASTAGSGEVFPVQ